MWFRSKMVYFQYFVTSLKTVCLSNTHYNFEKLKNCLVVSFACGLFVYM
jgi:hypothetical protein